MEALFKPFCVQFTRIKRLCLINFVNLSAQNIHNQFLCKVTKNTQTHIGTATVMPEAPNRLDTSHVVKTCQIATDTENIA